MAAQSDDIPRLSASDIELKAEEVIEFFEPEVLQRPTVTPIMSILNSTVERFGLIFEARDLGIAPSGHKVLGGFQQRPRAIFIDVSIAATNRAAFTLAHEYGHLVLHRSLRITKADYEFRDTERDLATGRKLLRTKRQWIEWQANRFASALLMPRATVAEALIRAQRAIGIVKHLGIVYLDEQQGNCRDFDSIRAALSETYNVNKTNIQHRLSDLGLLIDRRDKDVEHISLLLKEDESS